MNQASILALRAGIDQAKKDWSANPENYGAAHIALPLPILEELLDDLAAANETNVRAIKAREDADATTKAVMRGLKKKRKK